MRTRAIPAFVMVLALGGIAGFSRGLRVIDTVGMLVCGAVAGGSLAAFALGRR